jgi:hypothetical protein
MSAGSPPDSDRSLLPALATPAGGAPVGGQAGGGAGGCYPPEGPAPLAPSTPPPRQLSELPRDELEALAEDFGLDPTRFRTGPELVAAIHARRQLVAALDREAMLDVVRWGRRPVAVNVTREQLAQEIARIRSMKFSGLSRRGLFALAQLRGVAVQSGDDVPTLVKRLRRKEGLFSRFARARRGLIAAAVSRMIGESAAAPEYRFLPPQQQATPSGSSDKPGGRSPSIRDDIEESGLLGGLTNRIKKTADSYLNQKLDEIEARIDRKLDEIDRRLAEWRDKEIANRIRILKITLWASVIVGTFSLIYAYVKTYLPALFGK